MGIKHHNSAVECFILSTVLEIEEFIVTLYLVHLIVKLFFMVCSDFLYGCYKLNVVLYLVQYIYTVNVAPVIFWIKLLLLYVMLKFVYEVDYLV